MIGATAIRLMLLPEELDKRVKVLSQQHDNIRKQYAEGMTQRQLADNYGCSQRTIYNILHPDMYAKHRARHKAYMATHPDKRNTHEPGYQDELLTRKKRVVALSCSMSAFKTSSLLLPETEDKRKKFTDKQREEIRAAYNTGKHTYRSLAAEYGCSQSIIGLIINPAALERAREGSRQYAMTHRKKQDPEKVNEYQRELRARKRLLRDMTDSEEAESNGTPKEL